MVFYSTYLLNLLGMWPPVRSAGFAGPFTPPGSQFKIQTNSLFLLFLFTGLGESAWLGSELGDSRLTLPRKRCWDYQKAKGSTWWEGSPLGLYWWGGRVEGKNKGSLSAARSPVPLAPDFQTPGPLWARLRPSETASPFSNPNQVSPLFVPPELQPPRLGLGSGLPRKIRSASKQALAPALPRSAHTLHSPGWWQRGEAWRGNATPSSGGRNVGNGWVS